MPPRRRKGNARSVILCKVKAARVIQRYWKKRFAFATTQRLVEGMVTGEKIHSGYVKSIGFSRLVPMLREAHVIAAAKQALQRLHIQTTYLHGIAPGAGGNVNVRVFLAAYMIAFFPTDVFESMDRLEQSLFESANALLFSFEQVCAQVLDKGRRPQCFAKQTQRRETEAFAVNMVEYFKRFREWKVPDEAKLMCRIRNAILALYRARRHVPDSDVRMCEEFASNLKRLREKYQTIGGEEALSQLDHDIAEGGAVDEVQPVANAEGGSIIPGRMNNEELAHALLLNASFQLAEDGYTTEGGGDMTMFRRVRETFHDAFWLSVKEELDLPVPSYTRALRVLTEIRDGVKDLHNASIIAEVLDVDFIREQAQKGAYSTGDGIRLVCACVEEMSRLQTVNRRKQTEERFAVWKVSLEEGDPTGILVKGMAFMLDRVNAMRIDSANARLRLIAPVVQDHGIEYECGKFGEKVRTKSIVPIKTMEWMAATLASVANLGSQIRDMSTAARIDVHARAMMRLLSGDVTISHTTIPETLLFDTQRIKTYKTEFVFLVKGKTMLVLMGLERLPGASLPVTVQDIILQKAAAKDRMGQVLAVLEHMEPLEDFDVNKFVVPEEFKGLIANEMGNVQGGPVYSLMRLQLEKEIRNRIVNLDQNLTQHFFPNLETTSRLHVRTEALIAQFVKVAKLNRAVHATFYDHIIDHVLEAGNDRRLDLVLQRSFGMVA